MITRVVTIQIQYKYNTKSKQSVDQFRQKRAKYMRAYRANRSAYAKQKEASCKTSARIKKKKGGSAKKS